MPARCSPLRAKRTTSGTVFMRLSFMLSDSSFDMLPRSPGMSSRPFKLTFRTVRSLSCGAGHQNGRSESERPERGQPSTPQRECDSLTQPASPGHVGRTFANRVSSVLSMLPARRKGQGVAECGQMARLEHTTGRRERGRRPGGVIFVLNGERESTRTSQAELVELHVIGFIGNRSEFRRDDEPASPLSLLQIRLPHDGREDDAARAAKRSRQNPRAGPVVWRTAYVKRGTSF